MPAKGAQLCEACQEDVLAPRRSQFYCYSCALIVAPEQRCCNVCQSFPAPFERVVAALDYSFPVPHLIHHFKGHNQIHLADLMAQLIWLSWREHLQTNPPPPKIEAWVSVPSRPSAYQQRGFNPSTEIAKHLSFYSDIPFKQGGLILTAKSHTVPQKKASRAMRWQQTQDMYQANGSYAGQWVGLVDDVMTTGSTLHACAQALVQAGAQGVVAVVLARASGQSGKTSTIEDE